MVNSTNLPSRGTTREVGGIISASRRKNTVKESRILIDRDTWIYVNIYIFNRQIYIFNRQGYINICIIIERDT